MKEGVPKLILQLQQQEARLQTWESLTEEEIQEAIKTAEEWNSQGVPPEVQIDIAKKKSKSMVYHFTNKMYKWAGMRVFVLAARKTEKGMLLVTKPTPLYWYTSIWAHLRMSRTTNPFQSTTQVTAQILICISRNGEPEKMIKQLIELGIKKQMSK
ncbi:uncharacterized protein F5147DRAFT_659346 [Suillus discolor]|uniref:Uncharacterized protein n=1 Tax=Suillus discolor TaxID=1912936 RepID=A0A9P7JLJ4_9AGAM|nr:uncharacterized protein F5147DRAFT_659346 [Suillus discolor]KAG2085972.1 hypothetical protein F5147DRAFT_659346 [Suillus discolor]